MAQRPNQPEFFNTEFTAQATETMKSFAAWQYRAAQTFMDQSIRMTQSWMDMGHEAYKSSMNAGEGIRKDFTAITEKFFTP